MTEHSAPAQKRDEDPSRPGASRRGPAPAPRPPSFPFSLGLDPPVLRVGRSERECTKTFLSAL